MLQKFGLLFASLALVAIAGGQWAVLQSVAWAGMLHDYTQRTGSFAVAIEQTFDGAHPCELCREIASAKAKEQKEKPTAPGAKESAKVTALVSDSALPPLTPPGALLARTPAVSPSEPGRADQPPTPPPRSAASAA